MRVRFRRLLQLRVVPHSESESLSLARPDSGRPSQLGPIATRAAVLQSNRRLQFSNRALPETTHPAACDRQRYRCASPRQKSRAGNAAARRADNQSFPAVKFQVPSFKFHVPSSRSKLETWNLKLETTEVSASKDSTAQTKSPGSKIERQSSALSTPPSRSDDAKASS